MNSTMCGLEIKRIRKEHKDSIAELSKKLGYSFSYLAQIENGSKVVSKTFVERISDEYALDPTEREHLEKSRLISNPYIRIDASMLSTDKIDELFAGFNDSIV